MPSNKDNQYIEFYSQMCQRQLFALEHCETPEKVMEQLKVIEEMAALYHRVKYCLAFK